MLRLIALLLLIPLLDIILLVVISQFIGAPATIALVVLTALLGMLLVRAEGRHTIRKIERKISRGELPENELIDGGLLLAAGALFLTPGVVTDVVAVLLALPPTRYPVRWAAKKFVITPYVDRKTGGFATGDIYASGFPNPNANRDQDTYNLGKDDYSVNSGTGSED